MKNPVKKQRPLWWMTAIFRGILCLFILFGGSCITGRGKGFWASFPETPAYWDYQIGKVRVTIDHVQEDGIASQVGAIAETLLAVKKTRDPERSIPLDLDIRMEQRSFLHGVEFFNTTYVDCAVRNGEGDVVGRNYRYFVGKRSIISSKEQQRLLKQILKKIIQARRKQDWKAKRYWKKAHE